MLINTPLDLVHFSFFWGGEGGGCLFEAGRLLTFPTYRVGAYLRWALICGWAHNRINTVLTNVFITFINIIIIIIIVIIIISYY